MIVPHYEWRGDKRDRFLLRGDFSIELSCEFRSCALRSADFDVATISGRTLTVRQGFAWDGCTPNHLLGVPLLSVPSPAPTAGPSLVHDILCQFIDAPDCPWNLDFADGEFDRLLKEKRFALRRAYVAAVRIYHRFAPARTSDSALIIHPIQDPL
jgi:hypothetical protein